MSDTAIAIIVTGILNAITVIAGVVTLWIRSKYGDDRTKELTDGQTRVLTSKIDDTTAAVQTTGTVAAVNAKVAASAAAAAVAETRVISGKLNGGVDSAIRNAVDPLARTLAEHAAADEANVKSVEDKLKHLETYMHERNHVLLTAVQAQVIKLETLLAMARKQAEKTN